MSPKIPEGGGGGSSPGPRIIPRVFSFLKWLSKWVSELLFLGEQGWHSGESASSHQRVKCGPGSGPSPGVICGFSLLLVLILAQRGFTPGTPVFLSPQKPIFPNSNSIGNPRATGLSVPDCSSVTLVKQSWCLLLKEKVTKYTLSALQYYTFAARTPERALQPLVQFIISNAFIISYIADTFWLKTVRFKRCHFYVDEAENTPRRILVPRAHVTRPLVSLNKLTSRISGQAVQYDSKWRRAVLNFGLFWRGISVGLDAL